MFREKLQVAMVSDFSQADLDLLGCIIHNISPRLVEKLIRENRSIILIFADDSGNEEIANRIKSENEDLSVLLINRRIGADETANSIQFRVGIGPNGILHVPRNPRAINMLIELNKESSY